ncbi:VOC family protein [Amycolatopsis sp. NPDC005232]|uniref:VOC family protein n=1 Tax=Amycolatopsis sp. NPDC005232 TaxID=3157027 RepID=UPI0033B7D623
MAYDFQVTVDSAEPHTQADWWAETLGWAVEPSDEAFIREMIAKGYASEDETTVHRGVLVWRSGAAISHPETSRRVLFQEVPEGKTVKNRLHFDVRVGGPEYMEEEFAKLQARGATFLHRGSQGPNRWITLADPEGNEFCIG